MKVDYPLKSGVCVPWFHIWWFLVLNAFIKYIIYVCVFIKERDKVNHKIGKLRNAMRYKILSSEIQSKLLYEFQRVIYDALVNKLFFPSAIALLILSYYIPTVVAVGTTNTTTNATTNAGNNNNDANIHMEMEALTKIKSFSRSTDTDANTDANADESNVNKKQNMEKHTTNTTTKKTTKKTKNLNLVSVSVSTVSIPASGAAVAVTLPSNRSALSPFTKVGFADALSLQQFGRDDRVENPHLDGVVPQIEHIMDLHYVPEYVESLHAPQLRRLQRVESVYFWTKNVMSAVSLLIIVVSFAEWMNDHNHNTIGFWEAYVGLALVMHYHPSATSLNLMRFSPYLRLMMVFAAPIYGIKCGLGSDPPPRIRRELYWHQWLQRLTLFNYYCVHITRILAVPLVVFGGFRYISILFFAYVGVLIVVAIVGCFIAFIVKMCNICDCWQDISSELFKQSALYMFLFYYHSTSMMYIAAAVMDFNVGNVVVASYCNASNRTNAGYLDLSDGRVWWLALSWIL